MRHTIKAHKLTELILEVFRINGAIINTGNMLIEDLGLTSARWQVLGALKNRPITVSEISRQMGLSRQNVQRIANRLIQDGFIETIENPSHRRAKLCSLTLLGEEAIEEITKRQIVWANKISEDVNLENLEITLSELKNFRFELEKQHEEK